MRVLIIAGRWLAAVLGLSVLCIVLALVFFNPNARRDEFEAWISEQTGRSFTLEGELGWQVWPLLTVTLPHTRLGGAPGTRDATLPFAEWQQASLSVRLWPLVQGRLEFGAVQLRGLRVRLQRTAEGRNNWQDLLQLLTEDRPPGRFKFMSLDGLQVDDAEISLDDAATRRLTTLRVVSLQTSGMAFDRPIGVTLKAHASTQARADNRVVDSNLFSQSMDLPFTLVVQVQADAALQRWQVDNLQFAAQMTATGVLSGAGTINALPVTLRLRHAVWQVAQQQQLNALQVAVGDAQLVTDQVQLTQLDTTPQLVTTLQFKVAGLRQWLQGLGVEMPATRDANALQQLSAQWQVTGSMQDLRVRVPELLLDQSHFTGEVRMQRTGDAFHYAFDLHADQVDLDRYLPVTPPAGRDQPAFEPVPIEWLLSLHARGLLHIDRVHWQAIRAQQLTITLDGS